MYTFYIDEDIRFNMTEENIYVFDIDNTLYNRNTGLEAQLLNKTVEFIEDNLSMTQIEMFIKSLENIEYNTLEYIVYNYYPMVIYNLYKIISKNIYISTVIESIEYKNILSINKEIIDILKNSRVTKVLFTNGIPEHAKKVLEALGVEECFDVLICSRTIYKPMHKSYLKFNKIFNVNNYYFIDDKIKNIEEAKKCKWVTYLVNKDKSVTENIKYFLAIK